MTDQNATRGGRLAESQRDPERPVMMPRYHREQPCGEPINAGFSRADNDLASVFWWFERSGKHVRIEVLEVTSQHFELRMIDVDGAEQTETFSEATALARREEELQQLLYDAGWTGPHGWMI